MVMKLEVPASDKAREFLEEIITEMLFLFPITRDEVVGRINETWRHLDYIGDDDLIFHETARYWAMNIYYGKESKWWLGEDGLRPRLYPSHCPNGHELGPNQVTKGWLPCLCVEGRSGHRTWYCRTCGVTMYEPPHAP